MAFELRTYGTKEDYENNNQRVIIFNSLKDMKEFHLKNSWRYYFWEMVERSKK